MAIRGFNIQTVDTIFDLEDLATVPGQLVRTLGYFAANDGGGNIYQQVSNSAVCDGGKIFDGPGGDNSKVTSNVTYAGEPGSDGRFYAINQLGVRPEQYGANLGHASDSYRLQAAVQSNVNSGPLKRIERAAAPDLTTDIPEVGEAAIYRDISDTNDVKTYLIYHDRNHADAPETAVLKQMELTGESGIGYGGIGIVANTDTTATNNGTWALDSVVLTPDTGGWDGESLSSSLIAPSAANGNIVVNEDGVYKLHATISVESTAAQEFQFAFFRTSASNQISYTTKRVDFAVLSEDVASLSLSGIAQAASGDNFHIRVLMAAGGPSTILLEDGYFTVEKIG